MAHQAASQPFIPWAKPEFWGKEQEYVAKSLSSTWISGGPYVDQFEADFARYCDVSKVLSTSNGTTAIHLAYLGLGLRPGDEIIVPGFAFMAAANVALHMYAKPIFAEVDPDTWCLNAASIEKCLSPRTRAIVPIHTYGNVCAMDEILALAAAKNIPVIEDVAEAFASRYKHRLAGTMGLISTFSFQATKTITTGEGGMVISQEQDIYDKMWLYRNHGMKSKRYWHELPGYNFRLTNLQAALGCAQLEKLDEIIKARKRVHASYNRYLMNIPGLKVQHFAPEVDPVLWAIAVKLDGKAYPQGRDAVMQQMKEAQVETRPGFYAASLMDIYECPSLPICEEISQQVISLPTFPTLQDEQIEYIATQLQGLKQ